MDWPVGNRNLAPAIAFLLATGVFSGCAGSYQPIQSVPARPAAEPKAAPAAAPNESAGPAGIHHTIQPGQTLWRVSAAYGLTVDEVARINHIEDPTRIDVGDRLFIPGATEPLEIPAFRPQRVESRTQEWVWPVTDGRILSHFGAQRRSHRHAGVDILGKHGARVRAVDDGVVVYSGSSMRGYGKAVILDHGRGLSTLYAHNSSLGVKQGQRVKRGQTIARVGRTGNASTEHCHFEVRHDDVAMNPLSYVIPSLEARR